MTTRIRLPSLPEPAEKPSFPLLASLAPVVGAVLMWAFTQSPFALVFALLGPLVAVGGLIDSRRRHRKTRATAKAIYARALLKVGARIDCEHEAERAELVLSAAAALGPLTHGRVTHERWSCEPRDELTISLGVGTIASTLVLEGSTDDSAPSSHDTEDDAREELAARAARLAKAPVLVDLREGVGVVGGGPAAQALVRAVTIQLAHVLAPNSATIKGDAREHEWTGSLPHARAGEAMQAIHREASSATAIRVWTRDGRQLAIIATAHNESELPRECGVVVRMNGAGAEIVRWSARSPLPTSVRPHLISLEHATRLAKHMNRAAVADGLVDNDSIARLVTFADLGPQPQLSGDRTLACVFALGPANSPIQLDLVRDGPHALVGGTTGSGKSELLCAWILAMAATRTASELTVLLVDFKGGASFRIIESLPHCVGTVTDLDPAEAERALTSLRAELRYRERILAEHDVRDIAELEPAALSRLVIVVDEYAALVTEHPALHSVFADIAARGRSLGVHLILSTQRPAGVVRDAVFANAPIRVSLRVLDPAESVAVIGVADAARVGADQPGRALVLGCGRTVTTVQPALVTAADVEEVRVQHELACVNGDAAQHKPWLPPLPLVVSRHDISEREADGKGVRFALADRPEEQRRIVATFDPASNGHLLVVGARGSGRSTALAALAGTEKFPTDIEGAWDAVHEALDAVRAAHQPPRLCLIDDIDVVISRMPDDYRDAFVRSLSALLQEGPASGVHCALSSARIGPAVASVAALCESRLVLRMPDRHEHTIAGADPARFAPDLPPGRGWFRGDLVQVVESECAVQSEPAGEPSSVPLDHRSMLIVAARPAQLAARLDAAWGSGTTHVLGAGFASAPGALTVSEFGDDVRVVVADPETWQARWAQFTECSRAVPVAFHECTAAQYRQLTGNRTLPPPLARPADSMWLAHPSAAVSRAGVPSPVSDANPIELPSEPHETMDFE